MGLARSSYLYRAAGPDPRAEENAELRDRIEALALTFPRYGYRRMTAQLRLDGFVVNNKRVLRIMRESDLLCRVKRRTTATTDGRHELRTYPNLYRNEVPSGPDRAWVGDVTYIRLPEEFVYLAVLLDAWSRKVVGWSLSRRLDGGLTRAALEAAVASRKPPEGCIHHSDRGVRYASGDYVKCLTDNGFRVSMGRRGNPYDNAQAESFFKTLKAEEVHLTDYRTFEEAKERIERFIDEVYNQRRLHSALGYRSPEQFEQAFTRTQDDRAGSRTDCTG